MYIIYKYIIIYIIFHSLYLGEEKNNLSFLSLTNNLARIIIFILRVEETN